MLHANISPISRETVEGQGIWARLKAHLSNPTTWTSLVYLFAKFPLGLLSFVVVVTLIALTAGLVAAPFIYQSTNLEVNYRIGDWHVDTLAEALFCSIVGLGVGVISLHVTNALALVSGLFAQRMLGESESS